VGAGTLPGIGLISWGGVPQLGEKEKQRGKTADMLQLGWEVFGQDKNHKNYDEAGEAHPTGDGEGEEWETREG